MINITQAVILAGGEGRRLQPFTLKNPKPMIPVNRKPFLEHLIELLKTNGIKEVIILTGYLEEKIRKYFEDGSKFGIKIKYSYTPFIENGEENKSGIRLKNAEGLLNNHFLLLYCDNYWSLNLEKLVKYFDQHSSDVLTTIYSNKDNSTKNNILVNQDGYVIKYDKERKDKNLSGVDIGFFIVNKNVLDLLPTTNSVFETIVLSKLIKRKRLSGFVTDQKYYSIGDLKRVKLTEKFLLPKKNIFLDRDGVINKKPPKAEYVKTWSDFEFIPDAIKAMKILTSKNYTIFIISNQSGIARGMISKQNLSNIHKKMKQELKKHEVKIEKIYICPHGWDEGCDCRKPKPGLLIQASNENYIDLQKAIFIGDDERDKQAGDVVNCKTFLVNKNNSFLQIVSYILQ